MRVVVDDQSYISQIDVHKLHEHYQTELAQLKESNKELLDLVSALNGKVFCISDFPCRECHTCKLLKRVDDTLEKWKGKE
jgi:hypothetical protein